MTLPFPSIIGRALIVAAKLDWPASWHSLAMRLVPLVDRVQAGGQKGDLFERRCAPHPLMHVALRRQPQGAASFITSQTASSAGVWCRMM